MIYKVILLTNLFIRVLIKPRICIKQRQHICVPIDWFFFNLILLKEKIPQIPLYSNRLIQLYLIKVSMIKIELSLFIHLIPTVGFHVRFIVMSLINLIINYRGIKKHSLKVMLHAICFSRSTLTLYRKLITFFHNPEVLRKHGRKLTSWFSKSEQKMSRHKIFWKDASYLE